MSRSPDARAEVRIVPITVHHDRIGDRPPDAEGGVVPPDAAGSRRHVRRGHLIEHLRGVLEGLEAVCEALGDVDHLSVLGGERDREVERERGRVRAQVDDHVVDGPHGAADQLGLRVRAHLVVHAPERPALLVERDAALDEPRVEPVPLDLVLAPRAGEEAAMVLQPLGLDDDRARQRRFEEDHGYTATWGIGTTNWPPHPRMYAIWAMISSFRFQGRMST